jgi:DNA-binding MarR family transcriptional regulator
VDLRCAPPQTRVAGRSRRSYSYVLLLGVICAEEEEVLRALAMLAEDRLLHASDLARALGMSLSRASYILKRLVRWGLAKAELDPVNGKTVYSVRRDARWKRALVSMVFRASRDEEYAEELCRRVSKALGVGHGSQG